MTARTWGRSVIALLAGCAVLHAAEGGALAQFQAHLDSRAEALRAIPGFDATWRQVSRDTEGGLVATMEARLITTAEAARYEVVVRDGEEMVTRKLVMTRVDDEIRVYDALSRTLWFGSEEHPGMPVRAECPVLYDFLPFALARAPLDAGDRRPMVLADAVAFAEDEVALDRWYQDGVADSDPDDVWVEQRQSALQSDMPAIRGGLRLRCSMVFDEEERMQELDVSVIPFGTSPMPYVRVLVDAWRDVPGLAGSIPESVRIERWSMWKRDVKLGTMQVELMKMAVGEFAIADIATLDSTIADQIYDQDSGAWVATDP